MEVFLSGGDAFARGLIALSAAESLTDDLAAYLLEAASVSQPVAFVRGLRMCNFVSERNNEWCLISSARQYLLAQLAHQSDLSGNMHERLFSLSSSATSRREFSQLPQYLIEGPGRAYHASALAREEGLSEYVRLSLFGSPGQQWLGAQLAREQQDMGVLPSRAIEIDFLQGMVLYREGKVGEAEEYLRSVAQSDQSESRIEVAIALHIVGRLEARRRQTEIGEQKLQRSLEMLIDLNDLAGQSQVLHTLGQVASRDQKRLKEAEQLLQKSLEIKRSLADRSGESLVLHTLGNLLGHDKRRASEAEVLLRRSLELGDQARSGSHRAWVLHTLGGLIGRDGQRQADAEQLLRESLALEVSGGGLRGEAQVLHTLGQLVGRDRSRRVESENLLRRSLELGDRLNDRTHQAQVLRTLGRIIAWSDKIEAMRLFRRSLRINREISHHEGIRLVEEDIRRVSDRD